MVEVHSSPIQTDQPDLDLSPLKAASLIQTPTIERQIWVLVSLWLPVSGICFARRESERPQMRKKAV
jgi:hypothetical protein